MRFGLPLHPYSAIMILSALISLLLAVRAWYGNKREISWSFALYQSAVFVWSIFRLIQWEIPVPLIQLEALKVQYLGVLFIPAYLFMFARALAKKPARGWEVVLIHLPGAFFLLAIATNHWHRLFWQGDPFANLPLNPDGGPLFWAFVAYAYIHVIVSFAMMIKVALRSRGAFRYWLWHFIEFFALPFAANSVFVAFFIGKTAYDPTPAVFAVTGILQSIALGHFDISDAVPYAKNVVLESIDTPLLVVDAQGIIAGRNDEAKRLAPEGFELEGCKVGDLVACLEEPLGDREAREWSSGGIDYLISCYIVKRGGPRWRSRIYLFRDISQIVKTRRELEDARTRADAANEAKSAFVATVSHELRNPLNAIISLAELNLRSSPPPEIREDLEVILSSGNILLGLVNDLLDLSKIEAGKMELESLDFDIHEKTVSVLRAFRPAAEKKGIFLDLLIEEGTPRYVKGDSLRYGQILMNLVSNAVKFTEHGAVTVELGPLPHAVGEDHRPIAISASVRDTGMGIASDKLSLLFREFSQADPSVSRRFGGTGLGLSISKKLVELFGGEIKVLSSPGRGSTFSFTARFEAGDEAKVANAGQPEATGPAAQRLRVLVVDDDPINDAVAKRYLEKLGHIVSCATTGKDAVELASGGAFDLALLDLGLTDMDGYEACRRIRMATSSRPDGELPIAAMTARSEPEVRAACASAGMIHCLSKPLDPRVLDQILERIAEKVRQLGPRAASIVPTTAISGAEGATAPSPESSSAPLVNVPALLERLDGDGAFMRELLSIFVEEAPGRRKNFEAAAEKRDLESIQKQAHALKGSSLSLCANPVSVAAGSLEASCIAARRTGLAAEAAFAGIEEGLAKLEASLDETADAAAAIIRQGSQATSA